MCAQIVKRYFNFDFFRISQVNRGAVGEMKPGGHLDGPAGLIRHDRLQGHQQGCGNRAGWGLGFVGIIHGDVYTKRNILNKCQERNVLQYHGDNAREAKTKGFNLNTT
jgi:hypothetical protein